MTHFGITGKYDEVGEKSTRKRYSIMGNPRGAAVIKLIDQNSPVNPEIIEYREYEACSEQKAIEMARKEGLKTPMMLEIILGKLCPVSSEHPLNN